MVSAAMAALHCSFLWCWLVTNNDAHLARLEIPWRGLKHLASQGPHESKHQPASWFWRPKTDVSLWPSGDDAGIFWKTKQIALLLMPWLIVLSHDIHWVFAFHEEGFQLPVSYQYWEMISYTNIFPYFLITIQRKWLDTCLPPSSDA